MHFLTSCYIPRSYSEVLGAGTEARDSMGWWQVGWLGTVGAVTHTHTLHTSVFLHDIFYLTFPIYTVVSPKKGSGAFFGKYSIYFLPVHSCTARED